MEDLGQDQRFEVPAESGSKPSKLELWKKVPSEFFGEAVARSSDDTRAEVARNMRDLLQEKQEDEEEDPQTSNWQSIEVWIHGELKQRLQEAAEEKDIDLKKEASIRLQEALE